MGRELSRREQTLARRVAEAKAIVPHAYLTRRATLPRDTTGLSAGALISACGRAIAAHPPVNGAYRDGSVESYSRVNVAVTVPADDGELAPTLLDAASRSPGEIEAELAELRAGALDGSLTSPDLAGATFTLTMLERGAGTLLGPVTPGQAAHLGAAPAREVALVRDGNLVAGHEVELGLAFDARALRPQEATAFMQTLAELIGSASELES